MTSLCLKEKGHDFHSHCNSNSKLTVLIFKYSITIAKIKYNVEKKLERKKIFFLAFHSSCIIDCDYCTKSA